MAVDSKGNVYIAVVGNVTRQKLVAGDVASAPAGVPHFWEVENGKSVTYMTVKLGKKH
jgi:hypothetical protein